MDQDQRMVEEANLRSDYHAVFDTDAGARVLADMAKIGCVARSCHVPGDPYTTAFNAGTAKMVLRILDMVDGVNIRSIISAVRDTSNRRSV